MNEYAIALMRKRCPVCDAPLLRVYYRSNGEFKHLLLWCSRCGRLIVPPKLKEDSSFVKRIPKLKKKIEMHISHIQRISSSRM